jgi:hypothetical protein
MTTDFRSETFELSTDNHLADRAKLGSAPAFDELVHRHAAAAVSMAMVVTGDAQAAVPTAARAFTDVLDQMSTGGYSIEDPYLPGLTRSSRELALTDAAADPAMRERMDVRLPELARSTRWLTTAAGFDAAALALALDVEDQAVPGIVTWTDAVVAEKAEAVDAVLASVHVLIPTAFAPDARAIWRRWLATAGIEAPIAAAGTTAGAAGIESVAARVLRGAAVVLIVAGAIGAAAGIARHGDGGSGTTRIAQRAAVERPVDRGKNASSGLKGFDNPGDRPSLAGAETGLVVPASMSPDAMNAAMNDQQQGRALAASVDSGSWLWNQSKTALTGTPAPPPPRNSTPTGGSGTPTRRPAPPSSSPTSTPAQAATPVAPPAHNGTPTSPTRPGTGPSTPGMPPMTGPTPTKPPVTAPPVTTPPVTTAPVTTPPVTRPPVTVPPVTLPTITVPQVLAPVVGTTPGPVGGLLGGGR